MWERWMPWRYSAVELRGNWFCKTRQSNFLVNHEYSILRWKCDWKRDRPKSCDLIKIHSTIPISNENYST